MSDVSKKSKLGELLLKQGALSRQNLNQAILEQKERKHAAQEEGHNTNSIPALGELLIELGLINKTQLKQALGWQKKLRKTTIAIGFLAPFLSPFSVQAATSTGAPPAAQAISSIDGLNQKRQEILNGWFDAVKDSIVSDDQTLSTTQDSVKAGIPTIELAVTKIASGETVDLDPGDSDGDLGDGSGSDAGDGSDSDAGDGSGSDAGDGSDSDAGDGSAGTTVPDTDDSSHKIMLSWSTPDTRENGDDLELFEIGGYEIAYKKDNDSLYTSILIPDSQANSYAIDNLSTGTYEVKIATYDSDGVYSDYQTVNISIN